MIKDDFPIAGSDYEGGISDGWQYQTKFSGTTLNATLNMVKAFLEEEGYGDLPIPQTAEELMCFRLATKQEQIVLFGDNGYVHNPIKILFDPSDKLTKRLILCIFNEKAENHLLRFHGKIK